MGASRDFARVTTMPAIAPTAPIAHPNFPVADYPGACQSERRLSRLDELDRALADNAAPSDTIFNAFLDKFRYMGPLDIFYDKFCRGGVKADLLTCAAYCHVGSYRSGRAYLAAQKLIKRVSGDALSLIAAIAPEARQVILDTAVLGDGGQIVLIVPLSGLRVPIGAACFGDGKGAISAAEAARLLLHCDTEGRTLLNRFVVELRGIPYDPDAALVLPSWYALLRRGRDGLSGQDLAHIHAHLTDMGAAFRELAQGALANPRRRTLPLIPALTASATAYHSARGFASEAQMWREVARHHRAAGDFDAARVAQGCAGAAFVAAANEAADPAYSAEMHLLASAFDAFAAAPDPSAMVTTGRALLRHYARRAMVPEAMRIAQATGLDLPMELRRQVQPPSVKSRIPDQASATCARSNEP